VPELRGRLLDLTRDGQVLLVAHSQGTLSLAVNRGDLIELKAALEQQDSTDGDAFPMPPDTRPPYWMNFGRHSDYLGGRVFIDLQRPPSHPTEDRCDDVFFGDPTRRWRFRGQTQQARLWRHSFDYLDDTEDRRFAEHVASIIEDLQTRPGSPRP
jgi:hypothetical protein